MKYLTLSKSGTWYFRYQVPFFYRHLFDGRLEIKRSLRTSNKKKAIIAALQLEMEIRKRIMERPLKKFDEKVAQQIIQANARVVKMKINNALSPMSSQAAERLTSIAQDISHLNLRSIYSTNEIKNLLNLSEDIFDVSRSIDKQVSAELRRVEYDFSNQEILLLQTKQALSNIFAIAKEARSSMLKMDLDDCNMRLLQLKQYLNERNPATRPTKATEMSEIDIERQKKFSKKVTLQNVIDQYIAEKKVTVRESTLEATYKKISLVSSLTGNKDFNTLERRDAIKARDILLTWPSNVNKIKEFDGLPYTKIIKLNKLLGKPCLNESTVKDYLEKTSSVYKWAIRNQMATYNPFESIPISTKIKKKKNQQKDKYTDDELSLVFSTAIHTQCSFTHPYYYWLPLLAIYTGARLNELAQLYQDDIKQIDGIWCIRFCEFNKDQRLKNDASNRIVPIHNKLIELGFIDYIKINNGRVFPELKYTEKNGYGGNASKWYGRFKTKLGFEKGKDFHSLRHTVIDFYKQKTTVEERFVQGIVGHENGSITFDRYGKDFSPSILKPYVDLLSWDFETIIKYNLS
ncbi:site-specific integrase [Vibrio parahaemolyticus]|uniref:site-specific integrase n=1 Tax=Vibrio parahaemolyticus TaxID=670 RepID=UPI00234B70E4|nr:site-specific integrase [Vibrio parahaemolyticus]WCM64906.1 site-specific integrase [Vibrio parahaemolyticus]